MIYQYQNTLRAERYLTQFKGSLAYSLSYEVSPFYHNWDRQFDTKFEKNMTLTDFGPLEYGAMLTLVHHKPWPFMDVAPV